MRKFGEIFFTCLCVVAISGCATYYQKNHQFQEYFVHGKMEEANAVLDKNKKAAKDKNRLIYFLQKGIVEQHLGNNSISNDFFEQAFIFSEEYRKSYTKEVASLLSNPNAKPYTGEDHELVLLHYFKALNYFNLGDNEAALVECRRVNEKINLLNDRYEKKKNRYKKDAFALNLMGIAYEKEGEINDAFIAYRNAYEVYKTEYSAHFDTKVPAQLKKDILRTAYLLGFDEELKQFETEFSVKYVHEKKPEAELVFFWHNGMGPVKDEWSINFFIVKGQGGVMMFVNEELGLSFPFPLPANGSGTGGLGDLKFVRVAFPKYLERKPYFRTAELKSKGKIYELEKYEDINSIAHATLEDRMLRELANSLMRLALKQAAEQQTRKQNENLGALLSVMNAVSEKADTRNWQTLPHSISYARIPLEEGLNSVGLVAYSPKKSRTKEEKFEFTAKKGETIFHTFHSLESIPLGQDY